MIQEITLTKRVQTPTPPNEWCYQDQGEDFRYFTKRVLLGKNEEPWAECTDEEKTAWEEAHTTEEPAAAVVEPNGDMPAEALRPTEVAADASTTQVAEEGLGV